MAGVPMAMNQSCYALVGKGIHQLLVYFYTLKVIDRLRHKASGAVFDAVTTKDFESEHIMRLPESIEKVFLCAAEPMYQAILSNSIENQKLHKALIMVDKPTLQIVLMRLQGYKLREIADLLGLSEQTVYKRMQRFKKKIKKILK